MNPATGLSQRDARRHRALYGYNHLREARSVAWWWILGRQFKGLVVALLASAALVSFLFSEIVEGFAIVAVLAINAALGFVAELRAVRSMEALRQLGSEMTRVRRRGRERLIPAELLVPGDIVLFEGGDRITADLRIVEAAQLEADESVLTGESLPVAKLDETLDADIEPHARSNMLFKGTTVTRGAGVGVVVSTGMATELGRIAELVAEAEEETTPLERRLEELGRRLVGATFLIAATAAVAGIASGKEIFLMVQTGIALAVAAIPEGLPIVATIALARGMWRMARRNALINRLSAVETLGATTMILTDKTGTLTENRLSVRQIVTDSATYDLETPDVGTTGGTDPGAVNRKLVFRRAGAEVDHDADASLLQALRIGALCSGASISGEPGTWITVGDPLEVALLVAAASAGIERSDLLRDLPEVREEAFDARTKMMATFHRDGADLKVAVKGAAEAVIERSTTVSGTGGKRPLDEDEKERWTRSNAALAELGLRVLAVATKTVADADADPYKDLSLVGLCALLDPPRRDAAAAMDACRGAGIRVVMVTGDQAPTAAYIARAVRMTTDDEARVVAGHEIPDSDALTDDQRERLRETAIFARVDPEQKLDLIALHQEAGEVVAMTGDGVNDAPALKKADIGIAMGQRGTPVAQEAADMVLTDDSFSSIVAAVHQGRVILGNIRKFVVYLMSCNVSEVFVVTGAVVVDAPLPILPLQILFLNLVTDVFPALALALGEGDEGLMALPPRDPAEPILRRDHWLRIIGYGLVITAAVLGAFAVAIFWLGYGPRRAVTVSFATLAMAQLWHVFNLREPGSSLLRNDIVRNPWVWGALALCVGLVAAAVHLPGLSTVLRTENPGLVGWLVILGMSLVPLALGQVSKSFQGRFYSETHPPSTSIFGER